MGERKNWFLRALPWSETQTTLSGIWSQITVSMMIIAPLNALPYMSIFIWMLMWFCLIYSVCVNAYMCLTICVFNRISVCPVGWSCRAHWLRLCRHPTNNECPGYVTKQFDGEVPVMLDLCEIRSTPSLPSLRGPLWLGVVAPDRALSMGQIELNYVLTLNWIVWNRTVWGQKLILY